MLRVAKFLWYNFAICQIKGAFASDVEAGQRLCEEVLHYRLHVTETDSGNASLSTTAHIIIPADCTESETLRACEASFGFKRAPACQEHLSDFVSGVRALASARKSTPMLDFMSFFDRTTQKSHYLEIYQDCEASWGHEIEWRLQKAGDRVVDVYAPSGRDNVVQACLRSRYARDHEHERALNQHSSKWKANAFDILGMYSRYADDLRKVRAGAQAHCDNLYLRNTGHTYTECRPANNAEVHNEACTDIDGMHCQLSDIEAEITYLRLRTLRPQRVLELSPYRGWSTYWLLSALRDNGSGTLYSFDKINSAKEAIPLELAATAQATARTCSPAKGDASCSRWHFTLGDAHETLARLDDEQVQFDYLFIDSLHNAKFARMYLREVFERQRGPIRGSVHDCFQKRYGFGPGYSFALEECQEVIAWLSKRSSFDVEAGVFSASLRAQFDMYAVIMQHRWDLNISRGLDNDLIANNQNSMMLIGSIGLL